MDMLWALNRRFTRWSIVFGMPSKAPLGELTHHAQVAPSWSNLQVLNSQGCNVDLQLTSPGSWLHLQGVTALDFERLAAQGVTPTIQFASGGITQAFVHVNYGCESRQVMDSLAEQIQVGLDASVRAHIGSVSFPLPGFDCWSDEQLRVCRGISFDSNSMGTQLSNQLRHLKGEVDRSRTLGAVPALILEATTEGGAESLKEKRTVRGEPPRPSEY
ncbi:hypothetical protein TMS3_0107575 [Pseudomonas taeanensis MS-3]|uniref:Uncharacterized protein n=2 Tax=Pseudomonas taeanensis TaxID=574962 RepID=A0A0A1YPB9_9PSED|nr:hypothetical protein TMS3_0107575 [Pseudomonas taeanensis MS-3]